MIRSQLNSYSGADPIWGFVALIGSERYTGEAAENKGDWLSG